MTEAMIVEAVRAAGGVGGPAVSQTVRQVADPQAVEAFQKAIEPDGPAPVPMMSQIAETWRAAQTDQQTILHRMSALSDLSKLGGNSMAQLSALQYEVMNFAFQQDIVTNIAKKASDAVTTLVKNG